MGSARTTFSFFSSDGDFAFAEILARFFGNWELLLGVAPLGEVLFAPTFYESSS